MEPDTPARIYEIMQSNDLNKQMKILYQFYNLIRIIQFFRSALK